MNLFQGKYLVNNNIKYSKKKKKKKKEKMMLRNNSLGQPKTVSNICSAIL